MKIGIITFHRAYNYGAALQSYALFTYVKMLGHDVEIIDYLPNNCCNGSKSLVRRILHIVKSIIMFNSMMEDYKKSKYFNKFVLDRLNLSPRRYYGDNDIEQDPPQYDLYISGSDQILNMELTGDSKAYYLNFIKENIKLSYGSSFGREKISDKEKIMIKHELSTFRHLSVRERSAANIIQSQINRKPLLVADPVFLLDKGEWEELIDNAEANKNYILIYAMEVTKPLVRIANLLMKKNKQVFVVYGGAENSGISGKKIIPNGPIDFLKYIKNAEYVITNSFHGISFSLIFGKKIIGISHSTKNTRIQNLYELIEQKSKLISYNDEPNDFHNYIIDGKQAYANLNGIISESRSYLRNCFVITQ